MKIASLKRSVKHTIALSNFAFMIAFPDSNTQTYRSVFPSSIELYNHTTYDWGSQINLNIGSKIISEARWKLCTGFLGLKCIGTLVFHATIFDLKLLPEYDLDNPVTLKKFASDRIDEQWMESKQQFAVELGLSLAEMKTRGIGLDVPSDNELKTLTIAGNNCVMFDIDYRKDHPERIYYISLGKSNALELSFGIGLNIDVSDENFDTIYNYIQAIMDTVEIHRQGEPLQ